MSDKATFFFDPSCPWAWMTSRWMLEVAKHRNVDVEWKILSLYVLNEGRDLDADYREHINESKLGAQVIAGAAQENGPEIVEPLYTALGRRYHPEGRKNDPQAIAEAVAEVGLDASLIERAQAGEFDDSMRASTKEALDMVGDDVGVPVVAVNGVAFFGPVVTPAPKGDDALKLWDGCVLAASVPGFYELKRSRTSGPQFD